MQVFKSLLRFCRADCDPMHPMRYIYADVAAKKLVATNGHIIALLAIEPEDDEISCYLPPEAVRMACKGRRNSPTYGRVHARADVVFSAGIQFPSVFPSGTAPTPIRWEDIAARARDAKNEPIPGIGLNAHYLFLAGGLIQEMSQGKDPLVALEFPQGCASGDRPMRVTSERLPAGTEILLMPVRFA